MKNDLSTLQSQQNQNSDLQRVQQDINNDDESQYLKISS
jgi:hypothetical protein